MSSALKPDNYIVVIKSYTTNKWSVDNTRLKTISRKKNLRRYERSFLEGFVLELVVGWKTRK